VRSASGSLARVLELVDRGGLNPPARKGVGVRLPPRARCLNFRNTFCLNCSLRPTARPRWIALDGPCVTTGALKAIRTGAYLFPSLRGPQLSGHGCDASWVVF
jgi:hypothetical protein